MCRGFETFGPVSSGEFATARRDLAEQGSDEGMQEMRDTAVCVAERSWQVAQWNILFC
jgi:hypothetical protein